MLSLSALLLFSRSLFDSLLARFVYSFREEILERRILKGELNENFIKCSDSFALKSTQELLFFGIVFFVLISNFEIGI